MTWIPLLLGDSSPSLRLLVLKELLNKGEDDNEVQELIVILRIIIIYRSTITVHPF